MPTPVDEHKQPDLGGLISASTAIGKVLKPGDVVVYESTVYPGATEEDCVPVLEHVSGLEFNVDFFVGYSPERINPGDKTRRVATIKKITSGSTPEIADLVDELYNEIVVAGTHKAPSIRVAEAAKVIENTQRDLNIAIVNEFTMIFNRLGIDTEAVLQAAGHEMELPSLSARAGRRPLHGGRSLVPQPQGAGGRLLSRDHPGRAAAERLDGPLCRRPSHQGDGQEAHPCRGRPDSRAGPGFQGELPGHPQHPHCRLRARIVGFRRVSVDVSDPWVEPSDALREYAIELVAEPQRGAYDAIILAVAHDEYRALGATGIHAFGCDPHVVYDLKYVLPVGASDLRL